MAEAQATEHTAYQIKNGIVGNQEFGGALGMDFIVNSEITVNKLGAFDSGSNGISMPVIVQLWSRNDGGTPNNPNDDTGKELMVSATFASGDDGHAVKGSRFKDLDSPIKKHLYSCCCRDRIYRYQPGKKTPKIRFKGNMPLAEEKK